MTPEQEDALLSDLTAKSGGEWAYIGSRNAKDAIRLAIRAAVAQERERCAYICDRWSGVGDVVARAIAAAIRRG